MQLVHVAREGQTVSFPDYATARGQVPDAPVYWIDLLNPTPEEYASLAAAGLQAEVLADALEWENRPALRELPEAAVITFRVFHCHQEGEEFAVHPVHVLIAPPVVATIRTCADSWIEGLKAEVTRHPRMLSSVGHLVFLVLDAVVDGHFPALDNLEEMLEVLDGHILEESSTAALPEINKIKRMLLVIRRSVSPERDAINSLLLGRPEYLASGDVDDLRDLLYRMLLVIELAETYRDLLGDSLDAYLANVSNRLNEVMKILTMISTVFLPLTLITGFFGMNFARTWPPYGAGWGAAMVFGGMLGVVGFMLYYFKRKGWV